MAENRDPLLFVQLLQSTPGQEAINAFRDSWDTDNDLGRALGAAQQALERNGVWELTLITFFLDILRLVAESTRRDNNQPNR